MKYGLKTIRERAGSGNTLRRVIILGCPGSGKSTFAEKLQRCTGLPLTHLDMIWWKEDKTHVTRSEFDFKLAAVLGRDEWIIDGDYSRTYAVRLSACDAVFFLDYGEAECLLGIQERIGQARPDMPWTEDTLDPELVEEVHKYGDIQRPVILKLLRQHPEKETHIFHSRAEAEQWLTAHSICISADQTM